MDNPTPAADLAATLAAWSPLLPAQAALRDEYLTFLRTAPDDATRRDGGPEHVTGSCFVLTPDFSRVLLCYHRKGRFWVQLGGHVEADDATVADGAFREAREEGGVDVDPWDTVPVDLDRHALASAFGRCSVHWDVGYAAIAPADAVPTVSEESDAVAWWPVGALPDDVPAGFPDRLRSVIAEMSSRRPSPQA